MIYCDTPRGNGEDKLESVATTSGFYPTNTFVFVVAGSPENLQDDVTISDGDCFACTHNDVVHRVFGMKLSVCFSPKDVLSCAWGKLVISWLIILLARNLSDLEKIG